MIQVGDEIEVEVSRWTSRSKLTWLRGQVADLKFDAQGVAHSCLVRWNSRTMYEFQGAAASWFHVLWIRKLSLLELIAESAL